jgi:hypothetical protein
MSQVKARVNQAWFSSKQVLLLVNFTAESRSVDKLAVEHWESGEQVSRFWRSYKKKFTIQEMFLSIIGMKFQS